jgi:hypothetical protein
MHKPLARTLATALGSLALAAPAFAHHGWSSYDAGKTVKLEVPLAEVRYRNPHAEVEIDRDGKRWVVVLAPTGRMEARGLPKDGLAAGKVVVIEGYPRKDGTPEIRAERITVDGKVVELR